MIKEENFIKKVFNDIATKYDLMNDLISLGIHRLWKQKLLNSVPIGEKYINYLDVSCGTGDIGRLIIRKMFHNSKDNYFLTCIDPNPSMLQIALKRLLNTGLLSNKVKFIESSAENMSIPSDYFDCITCSFGVRNFSNLEKGLSEINRVIKKGGVFICLEFSPNLSNPVMQKIYNVYSDKIIPLIGKIAANNNESYEYLVKSIKDFPSSHEFISKLKEAGFSFIDYDVLTFGICNIFIAKK